MSSDFAIFTGIDGQATAVRRSSVVTVHNRPSAEEGKAGCVSICLGGNDYVLVDHRFSYVISELDQATIAPPAQLIPCDPMPLGVTIEQLGAVIGELTPMIEAIVQAKQV
jgi:hypothetical protein